MLAAESYAARVDAVLTQRMRLRGPEPTGDAFAGLPADHPVLRSDPKRPLEPNLAIIASYVEADDVLIDVGGGGGRYSLPLALHCREVINVDPSPSMLAAFEANARQAGISNIRCIQASWPLDAPPHGSLALVVHVTYLTRDIVPFVRELERVASRRVVMVVGNPPPPARNPETHGYVFGELSEAVPGHVELINVLHEMGIEPDVQMLPDPSSPPTPIMATREAAISAALAQLHINQWAHWPLPPDVVEHARKTVESRFADLFTPVDGGFRSRWTEPKHDVLITWEPRR